MMMKTSMAMIMMTALILPVAALPVIMTHAKPLQIM